MVDAKRVVIYGLANTTRDHRDYAVIGEYSFDLYARELFPRKLAPVKVRRTKKGRFSKRGKGKTSVQAQYRDPITGRFVKAPTFHPKPIPDDDTIVADVLRIVEDETGQRMYRTPSQREAGQDRVSIGIQHDVEVKRTYTYDEFLSEFRHRVKNDWGNR